jgi:hypothetical protein
MEENSLESKASAIGGISYSHGGFYGAALSLRMFMESLNGELFEEFRLFMNQLEIEGIMPSQHEISPHAMENNPVMSAVGHVVENIMQTRDTMFCTEIADQFGAQDIPSFPSTTRAVEWDVYYGGDLSSGKFNLERNLIISHGSAFDLVMEAVGLTSFGRLSSAPGSFQPQTWLKIYAKTLLLMINSQKNVPFCESLEDWVEEELRLLDKSLVHFFTESWQHLFSAMKSQGVSLVLDVKSGSVTPTMLQDTVRQLNEIGVIVEGFGSFRHEQLIGVENITQHVSQKCKPICFLHSVGDALNFCSKEENKICFFNAGSLIYNSGGKIYSKDVLQRLEDVNCSRNAIGIYVQEHFIDKEVLRFILTLYNEHQAIFEAGLAYGGINGFLCGPECDDLNSGMGLQSLIGRNDSGNFLC